MIRWATALVLALGLLVSAGAFMMMRAIGPDPQVTPAAEPPEPAAPPAEERLYFLSEVDFDAGEITLLLYHRPDGPLIIRDQTALRVARDSAYLAPITSDLAPVVGDTANTLLVLFRDDRAFAALPCPESGCQTVLQSNLQDLEAAATPHALIRTTGSDHAAYLETIAAIDQDPNFMLLDQRPSTGFPAPPMIPQITIALPTLQRASDTPFDPDNHAASLRETLAPLLPEGAKLDQIRVTPLPPAQITDRDNGRVVTAGGRPIPFPDVAHTAREVTLSGISDLTQDMLDAIANATTDPFDPTPLFEQFVATRLNSDCDSCFGFSLVGGVSDQVQIIERQPESYPLNYYDLRDPP